MTLAQERYVASRFDAVADRFRSGVDRDDFRLLGCLSAIGEPRGLRILDLGCGKGRFARHLKRLGADVVGLDPSSGMLAFATGLDGVKASATRLPFASGRFDGVIAIEVLEHISAQGCVDTLAEIVRVLRPGGRVAIVDKNVFALDVHRPWLPKLAVKWIDERRGLWMYPSDAPVRERWFRPGRLARQLRTAFDDVTVTHLLSPEESRFSVFRRVPMARLMTLWTARAAGGRDA
ncbi:MAG: ubiG 3 [Planctomycetota bacterium]|nr:ubiG 3 [Planctomycetota bacterium]